MNKTVNINLANMLFHIDEEAYNKMRRYLEAIKRSFANTPGSDEILADIEARIAELFHEKLENDRQVITMKQVDEVIAIMGQPEDYMVDEDIFEDEPKGAKTAQTAKRPKKLYRDTEQKYVAGVSSGLGHYFGIDPLWVRLLWILLTLGSSGGFILIYILLWILIPEATTTAQKLDMRGETVNISNIERKVKEGFEEVADKVKSVDYEKMGNQVKTTGKTFFDTLGDVFLFLFKIFGKFIGILLIIIGGSTLIGLFIGLITVGILDAVHIPGIDFYHIVNSSNLPVWLVSFLAFLAIGIPFFFLLYLGLKILVTNLKSIGNVAKFSLLGLWLLSVILLIVFGVREAASRAYSGTVTAEKELYFEAPLDTLHLALKRSEFYESDNKMRMDHMILVHDADGNPILQCEDVRVRIEKSTDSVFRMKVRKEARGPSFQEAKETAEEIIYDYSVQGNTLFLNDYLVTGEKDKYKHQEVRAYLMVPEGTVLTYDPGTSRSWILRADTDKDTDYLEGYIWKMSNRGTLLCQNCPPEMDGGSHGDNNRININEKGIDININGDGDKGKIKINAEGIDIDVRDNGESFKMKMDQNGIKVNTNTDDTAPLPKDSVN